MNLYNFIEFRNSNQKHKTHYRKCCIYELFYTQDTHDISVKNVVALYLIFYIRKLLTLTRKSFILNISLHNTQYKFIVQS